MLPKPSGLSADQVGAFHQNGAVWEYREAAVTGDQVVFETNLSAVKLAKKVTVPGNISSTVTGNQINIQWDVVKDASYELSKMENGIETIISDITENSYTDMVSYSSNYTYKVRAIVNGHQSVWSAATTAETGAPPGGSPGGGGGTPSTAIKPDGNYTIDYKVLKDGTNQTSVMQQYVARPAQLTISGGNYYVSITIKNSSWVREFEVTGNGGSASVVSSDEEADKRAVRFKVNDLSKKVDVFTHAVVPDINYNEKYTVQFAFDTSSIQEVASAGQGATPATSPKEVGVNGTDGGEVTHAGGTIIVFPAGAFEGSFQVAVEKLSEPSKLPLKNNMVIVSDALEITKNVDGKFKKAVTITIPFDKSLVDLEKYEFGMYWLNESTNEWMLLHNVKVDFENGKVSGETDHFTKFAVIAVNKATLEEEAVAEDEVKVEAEKKSCI